ncbi:MAG TPA: FAD-dependent oxidoreductase [Steroidobacteraceae bacterium]
MQTDNPSAAGRTNGAYAGHGPGLPVVVIGAGPVGLAAAIQLLKRNIPVVVFEAGTSAGSNISTWGHVQMFSPWRSNLDDTCTALLRESGWQSPPLDHCPTGKEFLDHYLHRLAAMPSLASTVRWGTRVAAVSRKGLGRTRADNRATRPFELTTVEPSGRTQRMNAAAVIDASGAWGQHAPLGASGLPALGEGKCRDRISYGMPDIAGADRRRYMGKRLLVVGSGYSAIGNLVACGELIDLDPRTKVFWALRSADITRALGKSADNYPQTRRLRDRLGALLSAAKIKALSPFELEAIEADGSGSLVVQGYEQDERRAVAVDHIISATGVRPDFSIHSELWLELNPVFECAKGIACLIDPTTHSCGSIRLHGANELAHPEPNFFIVGMKSYGRASTFLLPNGYEQARSVAAYLAGDVKQAAPRMNAVPCNG